MENFKVEGIVIHTTDFGDANRVVTLYTKELGKLEVNAYGCRRVRSPLSGVTQMFNHISAEVSRGTKVDTLRDADILHYYDGLTKDLERLGYAALFFEIVNRMTLPKQSDPKIFRLLLKSLPTMATRNPKVAALIAMNQFMEFSGQQLSFSRCVHCGKDLASDALMSFEEGGAICKSCGAVIEETFSYPEELRLTFEMMLSFDWQEETRLTFRSDRLAMSEKISLAYIRSILGSELNAVKFLRDLGVRI